MNVLLKKIGVMLLVIVLLSSLSIESEAQCAMCRVTVENNVSNGEDSIAAGLNKGILMLLATPYAAFAVVAFFWYRSSRKEHEKQYRLASFLRGKTS